MDLTLTINVNSLYFKTLYRLTETRDTDSIQAALEVVNGDYKILEKGTITATSETTKTVNFTGTFRRRCVEKSRLRAEVD